MSTRAPSFRSIVASTSAALLVTTLGTSAAFAAPQPGMAAKSAIDAPEPTDGRAKATAANEDRRYCIRFELTGSRISRTKCNTRAGWAAKGIDVDNPNG